MSIAFSVYFSESLKIIIMIALNPPLDLTSLLASWHSMWSFYVAEIVNLAVLGLADTSICVCYIIKTVVSSDWMLRQNSLVAR